MKKLLVLSLILPSVVLIGCGSGGGDSSSKTQSIESALKIGNVVMNAPQSVDYNNKTSQTFKRQKRAYDIIAKMGNNFEKETIKCDVNGTSEFELNADGSYSFFDNRCIDYNSETGKNDFTNGYISISQDAEHIEYSGYSEIEDYDNATEGIYYKDVKMYQHTEDNINEFKIDGTIEYYNVFSLYTFETTTYTSLIIKENKTKKSWYYKGGFYDKYGCFTQNHIYDTDDNHWLVEDSKNKDYWLSGTLYVDSMRYIYNKDMVTVTKGDNKGTFKQQEIIDELNKKKNEKDCTF